MSMQELPKIDAVLKIMDDINASRGFTIFDDEDRNIILDVSKMHKERCLERMNIVLSARKHVLDNELNGLLIKYPQVLHHFVQKQKQLEGIRANLIMDLQVQSAAARKTPIRMSTSGRTPNHSAIVEPQPLLTAEFNATNAANNIPNASNNMVVYTDLTNNALLVNQPQLQTQDNG